MTVASTHLPFDYDDSPISEVPGIPLWSENYAFTCTDAGAGIGFIAFLGRWWADPTVWREVVTFSLPGDRVVCIKNYGRGAGTAATTASASMFRVDIVRPGHTVRISYDGPAFAQSRAELISRGFQPSHALRCRFDLVLEAVSPVWNMHGHASHSADIAGALHIEQVGRGNGFLQYGNERFDVHRAFTNRDHSRGVRIMDKFKRHCWAQGHFEDQEITFSAYAIEMYGIEGLAMSNASVSKGDRRMTAEILEVELIEGYDDGCQPYRLVLSCELGTLELTKRDTIASLPTGVVNPFDMHVGAVPGAPSGFTFEEAVRWEWDGKTALGWSERCFVHTPLG